MKKNLVHLTTAQFAKMHNVNKRTLHYYDNIGLFLHVQKVRMVIDIMRFHKV